MTAPRFVLCLGLTLFGCVAGHGAQPNPNFQYSNPVRAGDYPDPAVIRVGNDYWATATSSEWAPHFPLLHSKDLVNWEVKGYVFQSAPAWAKSNFWAPEIHVYRGRCYMFITFKAEGVRRGTQILAADSPRGPFLPISSGPVTPHDWECLDGTLHVGTDGQPWIVFCHEWVQVGDGEICAMPLSADLTTALEPPRLLFRASEAPWAEEINSKNRRGYVTDGPSMHRLANGEWVMLWSSFRNSKYAVGVAKSASGEILGPWHQVPEPLFDADGGHCMVFRAFDGQLLLAFHSPNPSPDERPFFMPLREEGSSLKLG